MMRRIVAVGMSVVLLFGSQALASRSEINRKTPPRISLRYQGEVVQRARPFTFCWAYSNGDGTGTGMCADGFPRYPEPAEVQSPARLTLRIHYPAKPEEWFLHAYREVVRHEHRDEPVGNPETIPFKLRAKRVRGKIRAWDVVFRVEEPLRDYYLDTGGQLRQGDAFYALHVQT